MPNPSSTGVDRLRDMAQACLDGADNLVGALLCFTYAAMQSGRLTLGEGCTNSTTYFQWDGVRTVLVAVVGDPDADTSPLVTRSAGSVSLYRAVCVNGAALYRCGTSAGGHDATTPEGAVAMATTVLGAVTQADHRDVAKKLRPVVRGDKAPTVKAVRAAASDAMTPATREAGTGTVVTHKAQSTHEVANRLVGWIATTDWDIGDDGVDHLAATAAAVDIAAADLAAIMATREVDEVLEGLTV